MDLRRWLRVQWDRVGAVGLIGLGLLVLLLGWIGVSDQDLPAGQIPYVLSGGVLAIILVGIGATSWLSADLRDEWRKLDDVEELLGRIVDAPPGAQVAGRPEASAPPSPARDSRRALA